MNWPEILQRVTDEAIATFGAVTTVTAITPIVLIRGTAAVTADFDYLAASAGHIYYLENISVLEVVAITGNPIVQGYDLTPTAQSLWGPAVSAGYGKSLFVTRLAHLKNGGSVGNYSIIYSGFDLTYI